MAWELVLALMTGIFAGALFSAVRIPIPAPPNLPGILGIVGIYVGYKGIEWLGLRVDIVDLLSGLV
jgi:XapX domain-containing protein